MKSNECLHPKLLLEDAVKRIHMFVANNFPNPVHTLKVFRQLEIRGLLESTQISAVPAIRVERIWLYRPGEGSHDWQARASELHRRWACQTPRPVRVFWASRKAVNLLGGIMPGTMSPLDCISHDLGVTAMALTLFEQSERFREAWIPEQRFTAVYSHAQPDGAIAGTSGVECLFEFAGNYSYRRLETLAELSNTLQLPILFYTVVGEQS